MVPFMEAPYSPNQVKNLLHTEVHLANGLASLSSTERLVKRTSDLVVVVVVVVVVAAVVVVPLS